MFEVGRHIQEVVRVGEDNSSEWELGNDDWVLGT